MESDPIFHLNYAVSLMNAGKAPAAREQFNKFEALYAVRCCCAVLYTACCRCTRLVPPPSTTHLALQKMDADARDSDQDVVETRMALMAALGIVVGGGAAAGSSGRITTAPHGAKDVD